MNDTDVQSPARTVFGVPAVLTHAECAILLQDLTTLWGICYEAPISSLDDDLERCREFFNPIARGQTLRARLSQLESPPADLATRLASYGEPLVLDAGEGGLLVGVEARLLIELLRTRQARAGHIVLPDTEISALQYRALGLYRAWALGRLRQVIDLRSGRGKEPMQPIAVGIVLAILVNRSTTADRAVVQHDHDSADGQDVDPAIHAGANAFAAMIGTSSRGRSTSEQRLKGGYALTEARRRLAHRLALSAGSRPGEKLIFVPDVHVAEVVAFLGADLARRRSLTAAKLELAFDELARAFRAKAKALAYRSMVFDRPAETVDLRNRLLDSFTAARRGPVPRP
jgi:hypothetical protein